MKRIRMSLGILLLLAVLMTSGSVYASDNKFMCDSGRNSEEMSRTVKDEEIEEASVKTIISANEEKEDLVEAEKIGLENSWRYQYGEIITRNSKFVQWQTWPNVTGRVGCGVDVSYHNGKIDWEKAKKAGVDYAIIRCGYGMNQLSQDDGQWENNVKGCIENNIPFGVYIYSYATNVERAKSEAEHVLRLVKRYNFSYPIYYDLEDSSLPYKDKKKMGDIAETFCSIIESAGYEVGVYANTNWFTKYLTDDRFEQWERWVAQYNEECEYKGNYSMWQCSSQGKVSGISGNVDLNIDLKKRDLIKLVEIDGKIYCYHGKTQLFGEQRICGEWYYFDEITGAMQTGWQELGGRRLYYQPNGVMAKGELKIGKDWYYFKSSTGAMQTGWQELEGRRLYYQSNGVMAKGELKIGKDWYYFKSSTGAMQTGWQELEGRRLYYQSNGVMAKGELKIGNNWYYFKFSTGEMLKNKWHNGKYYGANGAWVRK